MSGIIAGDGNDDPARHYEQRYNELTQRNHNKSLASSTAGSLCESVNSRQYCNLREQPANGTLPTNQFYGSNNNQEPFKATENLLSNRLGEGSTTYSCASDATLFKKPQPVKRFNYSSKMVQQDDKMRLDLLVDSLHSFEDRSTFKFMIITIQALVHTLRNPPHPPPLNPVVLTDYVSNLVKDKYLSKRVPKSICGSFTSIDQASNSDQYACNSERSLRFDKPSTTSVISDSRVVLQDITQSSIYRTQSNRQPQDLPNYSYMNRGAPYLQQETSIVSEAANRSDRPPKGRKAMETLNEESVINIFNDSEMARMRDAAAARQEQSLETTTFNKRGRALPNTVSKATVNSSTVNANRITKVSAADNKKPNNRSKESTSGAENCTLDQTNKNISLLNGTANGVSRRGRPLKAPVKFWDTKGEEMSNEVLDESPLNESMTLRNKKVLDKTKTPTVRGRKTKTPPTLPQIPDNKLPKKSASNKARDKPTETGKENAGAENKKVTKKKAETPAVKNASSKVRVKKNKAVINQSTEKTIKKSAPKRKSKESNDPTTSKKKKTEDLMSSGMDDDDIFGPVNYKKTALNLKVALSPSAALLSAKKAAGEAQGKATPPCKAIGDMMVNESIHSVMSAAKEAPKQNEAIKRMIKKMEKDQTKSLSQQPKTKVQVKKTRQEDSRLNDLMEAVTSTYYVSNPMSSATLTVFRGEEMESDQSDMEEDDDDLE